MLIDCGTCEARGLYCDDCVVTALLDAPPSETLDAPASAATDARPTSALDQPPPGALSAPPLAALDRGELVALQTLADHGMIPPLSLADSGSKAS